MQDEARARKLLENKSLQELYDWMEKHNCLPTYLLYWDNKKWPTKEEYEEAMRQDHINILSKKIRFATKV